jgi:hypothetical protein
VNDPVAALSKPSAYGPDTEPSTVRTDTADRSFVTTPPGHTRGARLGLSPPSDQGPSHRYAGPPAGLAPNVTDQLQSESRASSCCRSSDGDGHLLLQAGMTMDLCSKIYPDISPKWLTAFMRVSKVNAALHVKAEVLYSWQ